MPEKQKSDQPKYPTIEEFEVMSSEDKLRLWVSLPIPAQKLLVGTSAFASDVNPLMAKPVSKLTDEEYAEAREALLGTPYFSETKTGRLKVAKQMKGFINIDLRRIWEEQKKREQ